MTKCKFFKHTHFPVFAPSLTNYNAYSFWSPPIESSWKFSLPTVLLAYSCSSLLGSKPTETINRAGISGFNFSSTSVLRLRFAPDKLLTFRTPMVKLVNALIKRSGRQTLINKHLWNSVREFSGNLSSASYSLNHLFHSWESKFYFNRLIFTNVLNISPCFESRNFGTVIFEDSSEITLPNKKSNYYLLNMLSFIYLAKISANSILWVFIKPVATLLKTISTKACLTFSMSLLESRASLNKTINCDRLYRYMFDNLFKMPKAKYIFEPKSEIGLNTSRFSSSYCWMFDDLFNDFVTIWDFSFVLFSDSIKALFSRMFPVESANYFSNLSYKSTS